MCWKLYFYGTRNVSCVSSSKFYENDEFHKIYRLSSLQHHIDENHIEHERTSKSYQQSELKVKFLDKYCTLNEYTGMKNTCEGFLNASVGVSCILDAPD